MKRSRVNGVLGVLGTQNGIVFFVEFDGRHGTGDRQIPVGLRKSRVRDDNTKYSNKKKKEQ